MKLPIKCSIWLNSKNIQTEGKKILPQILDIDPIMGSHREIIEINNPTLLIAARKSKMRLDQYLSTLFNLAYISETAYQKLCAEKFKGDREITIPGVGRIDVLCSDRVIEVKNIRHWKGGLGQVLSYGVFYPEHKLTLALTPDSKNCYKEEVINKVCNKYGVEVIYL